MNIISDIFEQLGGVASSAVKQAASDLTVGLVREAKKQIGSRLPEEKTSAAQSNPKTQKTIQDYLLRDQKMAQKRISQIRNDLASHNTQKVTTETQKLKPSAPPKAIYNPSFGVKQGMGSGEVTRGATG
jgi:hypothetical protein